MKLIPSRLLPALFFLPLAAADVQLAGVFGDHMVLQREADVAIWGTAEPGEQVRIRGTWSEEHESIVQASASGHWRTTIRTGAAGGPYQLIIQGSGRLVLDDVLLGEVWVCSGQSNMEWSITASADPEAEIAAAHHPRIRLFDVPRKVSVEPLDEVPGGSWAACSPETIPGFSAVAYHFGRNLQAELDIPIGLISTNWGGTVSEAWTSAGTLRRFEEFGPVLDKLEAAASGEVKEKSLAALRADWWGSFEKSDPAFRGGWLTGDAAGTAGGWAEVSVPARFADAKMEGFDGAMWFRREVEVPAAWSGKDLVVELGPVDDLDRTYVNGALVGETIEHGNWQRPRTYRIPAGSVNAGKNVIAVCALDTGGAGSLGVAGEVRPPMRLYPQGANPESGVRLEGTWLIQPGSPLGELPAYPRNDWLHQNVPTALFNGMISPLIPYGIRGAIWYQGESNRNRAAQYRRIFPAMIGDWRRLWGLGDFPFYFVQIAPFAYGGDTGQAAELREAQTFTMGAPNTGMAVTMDIGNPRDIHPRNKRDVGRRLALWALARDYGVDVVPSGPLYGGMVVVGSEVRLTFQYGEGLTAGDGAPSHFTIAGEDKVFHPAVARIEGEQVIVSSDAVPAPVAVRYAWGAADEPNLRNGAGLPAPSFRTDDWSPVSSDR